MEERQSNIGISPYRPLIRLTDGRMALPGGELVPPASQAATMVFLDENGFNFNNWVRQEPGWPKPTKNDSWDRWLQKLGEKDPQPTYSKMGLWMVHDVLQRTSLLVFQISNQDLYRFFTRMVYIHGVFLRQAWAWMASSIWWRGSYPAL